MIIVKTPFRMSFFGGGTDVPSFFNNGRGAVISTTFDKYVYVTVRHLPRFFQYTTELTYSKLERVNKVDDLEHPMVRNAMKYMDMHELHIAYDADLPARSGLGTSSSFAVGLLNAFYALKGKTASRKQLADDAIFVERVLCNEAGGWQDQIAASFGGMNRIDFSDGKYAVKPIAISPERKKKLSDRLMLFFTGFTRLSSKIQQSINHSLTTKRLEMEKMLEMVDKAQAILENEDADLDSFGRLLGEEWKIKREISEVVSTDFIDSLYQKGIDSGALGGKLLGAGGGGFLLFYVPESKRESVKNAIGLLEIPFEFEEDGSAVVYCSPEDYDKDNRLEL